MAKVAGMMSVLAFGAGTALAQTAPPRVEVGGQLNVLRLSASVVASRSASRPG